MLHLLLTYLDWPASLFTLLGVVGLARKNRLGWWCALVGNALWVVVAIRTEVWGLLALQGALAASGLYGLRRWRQQGTS